MSDYRRLYIRGGTYFFTIVVHRRQPLFANANNVAMLREAIRHVRAKRPFDLSAIVVMPDHLHCIWTLKGNDSDFSTRWQMIKARFSRRSPQLSKPVWQQRFWEHAIRDVNDLHRHLDYIHYNPVKHGHASSPGDWRWSSFKKFVREGWYTDNWGSQDDIKPIQALDFE